MPNFQHVLPSGGYLNETGTNTHVVPGSGYVVETAASVPPGGAVAGNQVRFRFYYAPQLGAPSPYLAKSRQRNTGFGIAPPPPAPPWADRHKRYLGAQPTHVQGAHQARRIRSQVMPPIPIGIIVDNVMRSVLVSGTGQLIADNVMRSVLVQNTATLLVDGVMRQVLVTNPPPLLPFPVFPALPYGFPVKVRPVMSTIVSVGPAGREARYPKQASALWEFDLTFEELRDQTQNQTLYNIFYGLLQYQQLVQHFLMMYGQGGMFAFDAPWDDSRANQPIGTGDGSTYVFPVYRTWGSTSAQLAELVGMVNTVTNVKVNGVTVNPAHYYINVNKLVFQDASGNLYPPANGAQITMTFSFYYVCQFVNDEQEFEMFGENRWSVKTLTIRSMIVR